LARTLAALASLPAHDAEVIVVDNAGTPPAMAPATLANGTPTRVVRRPTNEGAAGRNAGVAASEPSSEWIVMLDDDSHPLNVRFLDALREQPADVVGVCAEIMLPSRGELGPVREAGGLPEVPIGCGVAYRRGAYLAASVPGVAGTSGYDPRFGFYAEEYDLAARLMRAGGRIVLDRRFRVLHEKTPAGRSMDTILRRLVRNNAWVMRRYAPDAVRSEEVNRALARYARIAWKERATLGYVAGCAELLGTMMRQPRLEMDGAIWDRFTGKCACRRSLLRAWGERRFASAAIIGPGKNEHVVREVLAEMGVAIVDPAQSADALVIGTLSPGPALDAYEAMRVDARLVAPWAASGGLASSLTGESPGKVAGRAAA
jgi:GT2 family glycosyltransferase